MNDSSHEPRDEEIRNMVALMPRPYDLARSFLRTARQRDAAEEELKRDREDERRRAQIELCDELLAAATNDETFGVDDIIATREALCGETL